MKLRNKLIPLATVFATGAVIAPCTLTSCSAGGMVDLTAGNYAPTIKKAVTEGYVADEELAMEKWMAEVNEKPDVLIQDKLWSESRAVKGFADYSSINATSIKAQVKNVSVKYMTLTDGETDFKWPTVSMNFTITVETNWYVTGETSKTEVPVKKAAYETYRNNAAMYYPIIKYYYDASTPGNIYCSKVYESTWENIPIIFVDMPSKVKGVLKTDWFIAPYVKAIPYMELAKLDWKYSVKYANEDVFVFDKNGTRTSKTYTSSLDRTYTTYDKLISGPTPSSETSLYYTRGDLMLGVEALGSYYLSDITKE